MYVFKRQSDRKRGESDIVHPLVHLQITYHSLKLEQAEAGNRNPLISGRTHILGPSSPVFLEA